MISKYCSLLTVDSGGDIYIYILPGMDAFVATLILSDRALVAIESIVDNSRKDNKTNRSSHRSVT